MVDDCRDQRLLVGEVVVDLRAAHRRLGSDVVERYAGNAVTADEATRSFDDSLSGALTLCGEPHRFPGRSRHGRCGLRVVSAVP